MEIARLKPQEFRLGLLFHRCHARTRRLVNEGIRSLDINIRHLWVLSVAIEHAASTQKEASQMLDLNENVVVNIVDDLEARGLVKRQPAEHDQRARVLHVTPEGERVFKEANELMVHEYDALLSPLNPTERLDLMNLLHRFLSLTSTFVWI